MGDPKASIFSYGRQTNGMTGRVDGKTEGMSKGTAQRDAKYWQSLAKDAKAAKEMTTKIKADDAKVEKVADSVVPNTRYTIAPGMTLWGTNSNSAASAVADKAQGSEVDLPAAEGRRPVGAPQQDRIELK
ncbi:MAG: hypothetical protein WA191_05785 [Telluria sp.]